MWTFVAIWTVDSCCIKPHCWKKLEIITLSLVGFDGLMYFFIFFIHISLFVHSCCIAFLSIYRTFFPIFFYGPFESFGDLNSHILLQAVLNLQAPLEHSKEVNDYKNLIKTLVMGTDDIAFRIVIERWKLNFVLQICKSYFYTMDFHL